MKFRLASMGSVLVAAALCAASMTANATIIVPQTLEQMTVASSAVVRAQVVRRESSWDADHQRIHTYTELKVLDAVHKTADLGKTIVIRTMGGEVGDIGMRVAGVARFEVGEEVLVFLRADPLLITHFQVIGMSQGKYRIEGRGVSAVAVPSVEGLAFATRKPDGKMQVSDTGVDASKVPLTDVIARVKAALRTPAPAQTGPTTPVLPAAPAAPITPATGTK